MDLPPWNFDVIITSASGGEFIVSDSWGPNRLTHIIVGQSSLICRLIMSISSRPASAKIGGGQELPIFHHFHSLIIKYSSKASRVSLWVACWFSADVSSIGDCRRAGVGGVGWVECNYHRTTPFFLSHTYLPPHPPPPPPSPVCSS